MVGFGIGKVTSRIDGIGYIGAFALATIASPLASKLISSHKMTYWHGAGFPIAGILGNFLF